MKLFVYTLIVFISSFASAEQIDCVFTEPFKTIRVSEDGKTVTVFSYDEDAPVEAPVVETSVDGDVTAVIWGEEEDFHVLEYYLDPAGGSDGMSDRIFPYTGKYYVGDSPVLVGGCSTPSNPVKEP